MTRRTLSRLLALGALTLAGTAAYAVTRATAAAAKPAARVELVCCDLAGTSVDYGSVTPAVGFREVFGRHKLDITADELAGPMGKKKNDHIRDVLRLPRITAQWKTLHGGAAPTEADIEALTAEFVALDKEIIPKTSSPITGVPEALKALKARGVKIAYTSGYPRVLMDLCLKNLREAGTPVDTSCASDEVPAGRPAPYMLHHCMVATQVVDVRRCLAIGDTQADIEAGKNAGFITVGVAKSGMIVGLTEAEQRALPPAELAARVAAARAKLLAAGADYVIDDVAALPALVAAIESGEASPSHP